MAQNELYNGLLPERSALAVSKYSAKRYIYYFKHGFCYFKVFILLLL